MTAPSLDHLAPERRAQEILDAWLKSYFTGQPHDAPGGPFTFPKALPLFNQAVIPRDGTLPLLHCAFLDWPREERWHRGGDLGTWQATIATPASGVSYGLCEGTVVESVHGRRRRVLVGTDIRWQPSGPDLLEQTLTRGAWTTQRTIAAAASLVWERATPADGTTAAAGDYIEKTDAGAEVRRITPTDALWDGALKVIEGRAVMAWYALVNVGGDAPRADFTARGLVANLESLFRDAAKTADLARRGLRAWTILHGARNLGVQAARCHYLSTICTVRFLKPVEHTT